MTTTINDIQFDKQFFSQFNSLVVILYQSVEEVDLAIPLSCVNLLTFVKLFNKISDCQRFLTTNDVKTITLFIQSDNIQTWLYDNNPIPDNVQQIIIFCPYIKDIGYFKRWTKRYTQNETKVITNDQLQRELLVFGIDHIGKLCLQLEDDDDIQQLLKQHRKKLCTALMNSFRQELNKL